VRNRLGDGGSEAAAANVVYNRPSSVYSENACRPATAAAAAAVVIATSDVTDYHDDDGRSVLASRAPGSAAAVMATNCLCHYDDAKEGIGGASSCIRLAPDRRTMSTTNRLKMMRQQQHQSTADYQSGQLVDRPS